MFDSIRLITITTMKEAGEVKDSVALIHIRSEG